MSAKKINKYRSFVRGVGWISASLVPHRAPSGFADRVLERLESGRVPAPAWGLKPALAFAGLLGAFVLVFLPQRAPEKPEAKPQILSFTVDKPSVGRKEPITLRWKVANAKRVRIKRSDGALVGELTVNHSVQSDAIRLYHNEPGTYTFVLVALGDDGAKRPQKLD